eukprot:3936401-Rhodomonas_salina.2
MRASSSSGVVAYGASKRVLVWRAERAREKSRQTADNERPAVVSALPCTECDSACMRLAAAAGRPRVRGSSLGVTRM